MKNKLIESLLNNTISEYDCDLLAKNITLDDVKFIFLKIFGDKVSFDKADKGFLGFINKINKNNKKKKFFKKVKNKNFDGKIFLAEGDSWLKYPFFLNDITDCINKYTKHAVYSVASGGDWFSNIAFSSEYLEKIKEINPDYLLISGGGNDFISRNRLSFLIEENLDFNSMTFENNDYKLIRILSKKGYHIDKIKEILYGQKCINSNFKIVINLLKILYIKLLRSVIKTKKNIKIFVHGYDYPVPSNSKDNIIKLLMGNGKLLYQPLYQKGYKSKVEQKAIMSALLFNFNEMLFNISKRFSMVKFVDLRGFVGNKNWFDELHPTNKKFKEITNHIIDMI